MCDETDYKQNYLRENIIDKNYNPEDFIQFLTDNYGESATDIDQYSIEDLKKIVDQFTKENYAENKTASNIDIQENCINNNIDIQSDSINVQENKDIENVVDNKSTNNNNSALSDNVSSSNKIEHYLTNHHHLLSEVNDEVFEDVLNCKKIEVSEISFQKLSISITKPEKKEGGLFSKGYITYLVVTEPFNYEVRRRYSDFEWLRTVLSNQFPTFWIPPVPFKNYSDRFDNEFIDKRIRYLEKFMYSLAQNPTLSSTIYFYDFLYLSPDDFNEKKKKYSKLKAPVNLSDYQSIDGSLLSRVSNNDIAQYDTLKFYQNFSESIIDKISVSVRSLNTELIAVSNRMHEISDLFEQLSIVSVKTKDNRVVTDTYKSLKKIIKDWGVSYIKQKDLIDSEIREYLNYIKREFISLKDNITKTNTYKYNYEKSLKRLLDKKEDIFKTGNISYYEIPSNVLCNLDKDSLIKNKDYAKSYMLPKETEAVLNLKRIYGCYLSNIINEFTRVKDLNGLKHKEQFILVSEKLSDIITTIHLSWADLISYYSDVYDSNKK